MGLTGKINQALPTPIIQVALCDMTLLKDINSGKEMFLERSSKLGLADMHVVGNVLRTCST